jgi:hypothetical protein
VRPPAAVALDLSPGVTVSTTFEVTAAESCAGLDSSFELTYDATLPDGTGLTRTVRRALRIAGSCATLSGAVTGNGAALAGANVDVCPVGGGACRSARTGPGGEYAVGGIAPGRYDVRAFPAASFDAPPQERLDVTFAGGVRMDFAFTHFDVVPGGSTISPAHDFGMGVPVIYWGDVVTLTMDGPPACSGEWVLVDADGVAKRGDSLDLDGDGARDGQMAEGPAGHYVGRILPTPLSPPTIHGYFKVKTTLTCEAGVFAAVYDVYIDPSGAVADALGRPVDGATVTLLRSDTPAGPFTAVPAGDDAMSFANRTNPMLTDAGGHFGWDVIAGYYKVRAEKAGCTAPSGAPFAETAVLTIPPAVTGLDLRLACASLDATPPLTTAETSPAPNAKGWWRDSVDVTIAAVDTGSGVASIAVTTSGAQTDRTGVAGDRVVVPVTAEGVTVVRFVATDRVGNASAEGSVTVRIDRTPPSISCAAKPGMLWPPSHRLAPVSVALTVGDALSGATAELVSATSSEPDDGLGDGDSADDVQGWETGTPDVAGFLRAERSGRGPGRSYTLTYRASDLAGNVATCATTVAVPHSR